MLFGGTISVSVDDELRYDSEVTSGIAATPAEAPEEKASEQGVSSTPSNLTTERAGLSCSLFGNALDVIFL